MTVPGSELSDSAAKVQQALDRFGLNFQVHELPASTRTAEDASRAIGCAVGQIAKSLVFQCSPSGQPLLVIVSGANRVDVELLGRHLDEEILLADAGFVRAATGYAIGGVPPVGHKSPLRSLIDEDLMLFEQIWAAAGTPRAVFRLTPSTLLQITGGEVLRVC